MTIGDPYRVLVSGETLTNARRRVFRLGTSVRLDALSAVKRAMTEDGLPRVDAEDLVYGVMYAPRELDALSSPSLVVPTIEWEDARVEVEAARTDVEWLQAAMYVKLPDGVGTAALLGQLYRMRANTGLADDFYRKVMEAQAAAQAAAQVSPVSNRSMAEILGGGK
jgi:hypothetical protein